MSFRFLIFCYLRCIGLGGLMAFRNQEQRATSRGLSRRGMGRVFPAGLPGICVLCEGGPVFDPEELRIRPTYPPLRRLLCAYGTAPGE